MASAALVFGQLPAREAERANVTVVVCDTFGGSITGAKVSLTSVGPKEMFTAVGGAAKFDRIPFGLYDVEVSLLGFKLRNERVRVYQSNLVFQISLELGYPHGYVRPELSGSVQPYVTGQSELWVRLMALYSSDLVENTVTSAGKFELAGMAPGKYVLLIFQKDTVLAMKPVDILGGKQVVEIVLDSSGKQN